MPVHPTAVATVAGLTLAAALTASAVPAVPGRSEGPRSPVPAEDASTATGAAAYRVPVDGTVLRLFDPPEHPWSSGHRGVDLATSADDDVRAPGGGVVTFSGTVVDRGVVTIAHPDGLRSSLEPVTGAPPVGTTVVAGDHIGGLETSGHCGGTPCVHWGVRRGETYLDPLDLLGVGPVVLLPVP